MAGTASTATATARPRRRPFCLTVPPGYAVLLGVISTMPQLYYVLFALGRDTIGPHSNHVIIPLCLLPTLLFCRLLFAPADDVL